MYRAQLAAASLMLAFSMASTAQAFQDYGYEDYGYEMFQEAPVAIEEQPPMEAPVQEQPAPPPVATMPVAAVAMQTLTFNPMQLDVAAGTTVVWTNLDPFEHSVTADDGSYDSLLIPAGGTFSLTFSAPGTYSYYCAPHGSPGGGGMAGTVVVS